MLNFNFASLVCLPITKIWCNVTFFFYFPCMSIVDSGLPTCHYISVILRPYSWLELYQFFSCNVIMKFFISELVLFSSDRIFLFSILDTWRLAASKISTATDHVLASTVQLTEFCVALNTTWYQFIIHTKLNIELFKHSLITI